MDDKISVFFNTPCFQRFSLTRIVFEQRADAIKKLKKAGIEAQQVVVSDDENLDIAKEFGFLTVERDNEWLGRRFNDGYQCAYENGADYVFPIGSDSWCDPQFIINAFEKSERAPQSDKIRDFAAVCSRHYTRINGLGTIRRQLWVPVLQGVSYLIPRTALAQLPTPRPCSDEIARGCDGSTWQHVTRVGCKAYFIESHPLETTSFESWPQITAFEKLGGRWGRGDVSGEAAISGLELLYPKHLVDKITEFYEQRRDEKTDSGVSRGDVDARAKQIVMQVLNNNKIPSIVRQKAKPYIEEAARRGLLEAR